MSKVLSTKRKHASVRRIQRRGTDRFTLTPPGSEAYYACLLTLTEADAHSGARVITQPSRGTLGTQEIQVEWWHGVGDRVSYQLEAFTRPVDDPPNAPSPTRQVTDFVPSQHGFHFRNAFSSVPLITIPVPFGTVKLGDASNGLCGGMAFCALDYFLAQRSVPAMRTPPSTGMLFDTLVRRLLNSFNLPLGILGYIVLMNPDYPDGETRSGGINFAPHGRAWQNIRVEWPVIKDMLDTGTPCPLGLVRVKSRDLSQLGHNHQVLATGYEVNDDLLSLFIYDPNYPDRDDVTLSLSLTAPEQPTPITYSPGDLPVYAFFHVHYKFRTPPAV